MNDCDTQPPIVRYYRSTTSLRIVFYCTMPGIPTTTIFILLEKRNWYGCLLSPGLVLSKLVIPVLGNLMVGVKRNVRPMHEVVHH